MLTWADRGGSPGRPPRSLIAYHEAGHAVVGHHQGLTFSVIYLGDATGQVIFDEQWDPDVSADDRKLMTAALRRAMLLYDAGLDPSRPPADTTHRRCAHDSGPAPGQAAVFGGGEGPARARAERTPCGD